MYVHVYVFMIECMDNIMYTGIGIRLPFFSTFQLCVVFTPNLLFGFA